MKNRIVFLISLLLIILLWSCGSNKKIADPIPSIIRVDSIVEKEVIKYIDTTIVIKGEEVHIYDTIFDFKDCPNVEPKAIVKKQGNISISATLNKGVLKVDCKTDSLQHIIKGLESRLILKEAISKYNETKVVEVDKIVHKYKYPWWWFIPLLYTFASLFYIFRNPIISLLKRFL